MLSANSKNISIGIIGGTGKEGKGLAYRWAKAGHSICIGSRTSENAALAANEIKNQLRTDAFVTGNLNIIAAQRSDVVVLTIPYNTHRTMLEELKPHLAGKLVIDVVVPLKPPAITTVQMPESGSAAQEAWSILGDIAQIGAAFHNISSDIFLSPTSDETSHVLVTGATKETRLRILELVKDAGFVGWDAGPLENSVVLEGLTSILIGINRTYKSNHAGIKITGIERKD